MTEMKQFFSHEIISEENKCNPKYFENNMPNRELIGILKDVEEEFKRIFPDLDIRDIVEYGSQVNGRYTSNSDIDIAVITNKRIKGQAQLLRFIKSINPNFNITNFQDLARIEDVSGFVDVMVREQGSSKKALPTPQYSSYTQSWNK